MAINDVIEVSGTPKNRLNAGAKVYINRREVFKSSLLKVITKTLTKMFFGSCDEKDFEADIYFSNVNSNKDW